MSFRRKYLFPIILLFSFLLVFSSMSWADHPHDGHHNLVMMPTDCVGCHDSSGGPDGGGHYETIDGHLVWIPGGQSVNLSVIGEHKVRLGYANHRLCAYCHYNPESPFFNDPTFPWDDDPDLAVALTFGRRNTNPRGYIEPVYCAYCHVTENRSIREHVGEHDRAEVPLSCRGCHGNTLKEVHIDPVKNIPDEADLPPASDPEYAAAYAAGLADLKLACYNCHGDSVTEYVYNASGVLIATNVKFVQDPVVRAVVASGIAGNDVTCEACHPTHHSDNPDHNNSGFPMPLPLGCDGCHSGNVVTEHLDNHGLECVTCHTSTDPQVIASIQAGLGSNGTYQDCSACHGAADHAAAHDHAVLPDNNCNRCHSSAIVTEHAAHGFNDCGICHDNPAYDAIIALGQAGTDVTCIACHENVVADHAVAHDQIYLRTRVGGTETIITSEDDSADGLYDNLAAYLPSLTCGVCHKGIAENHWGNFHSGLRVADLFDSAGNPLPRGEIDPARPWITGPGMVGNWCAAYNRQLPDLTAAFANQAEFLAQVDMGVFEFIKECGSCHVGGGPGAENPFGFNGFSSNALDDSVRATALDNDSVALNAWDFYVDESGSVTRGNWFADSGILDVDCLMCHLKDYDHLARNASIREAGKFAAGAALGAGVAVPDALVSAELDYATHQVSRDGANQLYLNKNFSARIAALPEDDNCLSCHMPDMVMNEKEATKGDFWQSRYYAAAAVPSLDPENPDPLLAANRKPALKRNAMLKRGASWRSDEVHKFMGCSGCHSRTSKTQATNPVSAPDNYLHSPGKGFDPLKYPAAADGSVKLCEDCHVRYGYLDDDGDRDMLPFAPPEMLVYHAQAGLLAKVVPTARRIADDSGAEETFLGNHIDIIACVSCHVQKRYSAARSVDHSTGGTYYNQVGAAPGQLPGAEIVDLAYSWKENVRARVIDGQPNSDWRRQIFPFNYMTSSYWDNVGSADANGDGFITGAVNGLTTVVGDPFFERTIKAYFAYDYVNDFNDRVVSGLPGVAAFDQRSEWAVAGTDGNVIFTTGAEIDAFKSFVNGTNAGYTPRLNLEARPNLVVHNILPIRSGVGLSGGESFALGAPSRDHLGNVDSYGCNDCHGGGNGLFNGSVTMLGQAQRIIDSVEIPLTVAWNGAGDVKATALAWNREGTPLEIDFSSANQTRSPERREFLGYDAARQTMLNNMDPASYGVGVDPVADIESVGTFPATGLPADEVVWAASTQAPIEIEIDATVNLVAVAAGTVGTFEYRWNVNDEPGILVGLNVEKTFSHIGTWTVLLTVIDEEGRLSQNVQKVSVMPPSAATQVVITVTSGSPVVTLQLSDLPPHDQVRFYFGDGTSQYISDAVNTMNLDRDYRLKDTYRMIYDPDTKARYDSENDPTPGNEYDAWVYKTSIRLYLGDVWVDNETVNIPVVIPVL